MAKNSKTYVVFSSKTTGEGNISNDEDDKEQYTDTSANKEILIDLIGQSNHKSTKIEMEKRDNELQTFVKNIVLQAISTVLDNTYEISNTLEAISIQTMLIDILNDKVFIADTIEIETLNSLNSKDVISESITMKTGSLIANNRITDEGITTPVMKSKEEHNCGQRCKQLCDNSLESSNLYCQIPSTMKSVAEISASNGNHTDISIPTGPNIPNLSSKSINTDNSISPIDNTSKISQSSKKSSEKLNKALSGKFEITDKAKFQTRSAKTISNVPITTNACTSRYVHRNTLKLIEENKESFISNKADLDILNVGTDDKKAISDMKLAKPALNSDNKFMLASADILVPQADNMINHSCIISADTSLSSKSSADDVVSGKIQLNSNIKPTKSKAGVKPSLLSTSQNKLTKSFTCKQGNLKSKEATTNILSSHSKTLKTFLNKEYAKELISNKHSDYRTLTKADNVSSLTFKAITEGTLEAKPKIINSNTDDISVKTSYDDPSNVSNISQRNKNIIDSKAMMAKVITAQTDTKEVLLKEKSPENSNNTNSNIVSNLTRQVETKNVLSSKIKPSKTTLSRKSPWLSTSNKKSTDMSKLRKRNVSRLASNPETVDSSTLISQTITRRVLSNQKSAKVSSNENSKILTNNAGFISKELVNSTLNAKSNKFEPLSTFSEKKYGLSPTTEGNNNRLNNNGETNQANNKNMVPSLKSTKTSMSTENRVETSNFTAYNISSKAKLYFKTDSVNALKCNKAAHTTSFDENVVNELSIKDTVINDANTVEDKSEVKEYNTKSSDVTAGTLAKNINNIEKDNKALSTDLNAQRKPESDKLITTNTTADTLELLCPKEKLMKTINSINPKIDSKYKNASGVKSILSTVSEKNVLNTNNIDEQSFSYEPTGKKDISKLKMKISEMYIVFDDKSVTESINIHNTSTITRESIAKEALINDEIVDVSDTGRKANSTEIEFREYVNGDLVETEIQVISLSKTENSVISTAIRKSNKDEVKRKTRDGIVISGENFETGEWFESADVSNARPKGSRQTDAHAQEVSDIEKIKALAINEVTEEKG